MGTINYFSAGAAQIGVGQQNKCDLPSVPGHAPGQTGPRVKSPQTGRKPPAGGCNSYETEEYSPISFSLSPYESPVSPVPLHVRS